MNDKQLRTLRGHQKFFAEQLRDLRAAEERGAANVPVGEVEAIRGAAVEIQRDFPNMIPSIDDEALVYRSSGTWVQIAGLRSYVARVVAALDAELEEVDRTGAIYELRDFSFVVDDQLRAIIERDYVDAQQALSAGSWKAVIVLAGGCIEGVLLDLLQQHPEARQATSKVRSADLSRWDLIDLIKVAVELKLIGVGIDKFSDSVREFRNLIHPGNEVRTGLPVTPESARIAFEVLNMLQADLSAR